MKRVAAMTVIRGEGNCEALMNGVVSEEMKKMNERHAKEMAVLRAELEATKNKEKQLLSDRMAVIKASNAKPVQLFARVKEALVTAWCVLWAITHEWKFWEWMDDEHM